jgi:hypothetical protein
VWGDRSIADSLRAAQIRRQEEDAVEQTGLQRVQSERQLGHSLLQERLGEGAFGLQQSIQGAAEGQWQEAWLKSARQASKDEGDMYFSANNASGRAAPRAAPQAIATPAPSREVPPGTTLPSEQLSPLIPQRAEQPMPLLPNAATQLPLSSNTSPSVSIWGGGSLGGGSTNRSPIAEASVFNGTPPAIKEDMPMIAPQSQHFDFFSGRRRRPFVPDAQDETAAAATLRLGAVVEAPSTQSYNSVAVQESFIPRLWEVAQKLSAMGQSWARVVIPVDAQTKVTVRFSAAAGRIKIHLSTAHSALAQMIAAAWGLLTRQGAQNGIIIDEPTFDHNEYVN